MSENNNENYKIILEYIKDLSIETPNVQALTFVRQNLSNYIMDIDISTVALKNNALEVTTKLTLQDKKDSLEKSFFEIKYATVIGIDTNISDKKIIGKIVLCDLQKEIYPKIKEIFLGLIKKSGYPELTFEKAVDFEKLYIDKFNWRNFFLFLFLRIAYVVRAHVRQVLLFRHDIQFLNFLKTDFRYFFQLLDQV